MSYTNADEIRDMTDGIEADILAMMRMKNIQALDETRKAAHTKLDRIFEAREDQILKGTPLPEPTPLSLAQLMKMEGKPVYVKDIKQWAIVHIESDSRTDPGTPFVKGIHFNWDVAMRGLKCYHREVP